MYYIHKCNIPDRLLLSHALYKNYKHVYIYNIIPNLVNVISYIYTM